MSLYYRDYLKKDQSPRRGPASWSIVTRLIALNVTVYILNNLLFYNPTRTFLGLSLSELRAFHLWTPITYQFVHASLWHLIANMIGLYFLGDLLLRLVAPKHVLAIYLIGGLVAGAFQLTWSAIFGIDPMVIGASGSVLAIVFAVVALVPYQRIQLLLFFLIPVNMSMRQVGWLILAINALTLFGGDLISRGAPVAVMAHFGGMLLGWAYIRLGWHNERERTSGHRRPRVRRTKTAIPVQGTAPIRRSRNSLPHEIDAILDKINEYGFQSLTEEEKKTLERGSAHLAQRLDRND